MHECKCCGITMDMKNSLYQRYPSKTNEGITKVSKLIKKSPVKQLA